MLQHISKLTWILIALSILLIGYGELARILKIYYFWESSQIGGLIFFMTVVSLIGDFLTFKFEKYKYGIAILKVLFIVFWITIGFFISQSNKESDAYKSAQSYIYNSNNLKTELGNFKIGEWPYKSELSTIQIGNQSSGSATFGFILKGENKYEDFEISVVKKPDDKNWMINKK